MTSVTPFLWFDKDALPAAEFYTSLIPNSEIKEVNRSPVSGDVFSLTFTVAGREFFALNGGPHYEFTPALSLFVECADQAEVDKYWDALTADGGEESRCGWLKDKWGLSWQIVPKRLGEVLSNLDPIKAKAAMEAMLQMNKIIVADDLLTSKASVEKTAVNYSDANVKLSLRPSKRKEITRINFIKLHNKRKSHQI